MEYIIPTEKSICELNRLFMMFDNEVVSLDFCLNRIRLAINEYSLPSNIISILADIMLGVTNDKDLHNSLMHAWTRLLMQIYYYIVKGDMLLPITQFKLTRYDLVIVTVG